MQYFQKYIDNHQINLSLELKLIKKKHQLFVIIPCYNEPELLETLTSLNKCTKPQKNVLVLVIINSSLSAPINILNQNLKTIKELEIFSKSNLNFTLSWLHEKNIQNKKAGVGFARKTGMDQIIAYCNSYQINDAILISLDADTLVQANYFIEIENIYRENPKLEACSIYFEHPIEGNEYLPEIYDSIIEYELHLRYYKNAIKTTGFLNYYYTIGSAFTVSASSYVKYGGMNSNKAGEDFYFLSKIFPNQKYKELNTTCIIPSSRPSDRVPFGTGPMINELCKLNRIELLTYNYEAFQILKSFFAQTENFYNKSENQIIELLKIQNNIIIPFLTEHQFVTKILEINQNVANIESFKKRYYNWFNAFKILKFLNFTHPKNFKKISVKKEVIRLLKNLDLNDIPNDSKTLLKILRKKDRE